MFYKIVDINKLNIEEIKNGVSESRIEKAMRYKHDADRNRSIAVEYILNILINEHLADVSTPVNLTYDEKGKPHIYNEKGEDRLQFSLSHSGDYAACIISDVECGIDVEKHSDRDYKKIAKRICSEKEIESYVVDKSSFYDIWTLKESVLKAVGLGLSLDMRDFEFSKNENGIFMTEVNNRRYRGQIIEAPDGYSLSYVEEIKYN